MTQYKVPSHIDPNKIFLVNRSELDKRFDPTIVIYNRISQFFKYKTEKLKYLLISKPQYGANESGIARTDINEPRYIRITDIDENGFLSNDIGATAKNIEDKYILGNNDILLARSGATAGKAFIFNKKNIQYPCFFAGYMIRFVVNESKILSKYFFIYTQLNIYKKWVKAIQRVAGQPNINAEEYQSLKIPLPPLEIQQQIVDLYQEAYQQKQQKEAEAKTLLESIDTYLLNELGVAIPQKDNSLQNRIFTTPFSEVSGGRLEPKYYTQIYIENEHNLYNSKYSLISVSKITSIVSDGTHYTPKYVDEGIKFISVKDVRKSTIDLNNSKYITEEEANSLDKRCKPQFGDILLTKVGTIGLAAVVQTKERFQIFVSLALLRPKHNIVFPEYLEIILNSECIYLQYDRIVKGAGVPDLHLEDIRKIKIPLPPLEKQNEIAEHIQGIRAQAKELQEQAQKILEEAKQEVEKMILRD